MWLPISSTRFQMWSFTVGPPSPWMVGRVYWRKGANMTERGLGDAGNHAPPAPAGVLGARGGGVTPPGPPGGPRAGRRPAGRGAGAGPGPAGPPPQGRPGRGAPGPPRPGPR